MAPPIESAAASTICLQWRWGEGEGEEGEEGERRTGGMLEGEGQKERGRSARGGWSVCLCESVGGARRVRE